MSDQTCGMPDNCICNRCHLDLKPLDELPEESCDVSCNLCEEKLEEKLTNMSPEQRAKQKADQIKAFNKAYKEVNQELTALRASTPTPPTEENKDGKSF